MIHSKEIKMCVNCGVGYIPTGRNQKYCTKDCWRKSNPQTEYNKVKMRIWRARRKS